MRFWGYYFLAAFVILAASASIFMLTTNLTIKSVAIMSFVCHGIIFLAFHLAYELIEPFTNLEKKGTYGISQEHL